MICFVILRSPLCAPQGAGTAEGQAEAGQQLAGHGPWVDLGCVLEAEKRAMALGVLQRTQR